MSPYWTDVNQNGFAVIAEILDGEEVGSLARAISKANEQEGVRKRGGVYAIRNLLDLVPQAADLAICPSVIGIAHKVLGSDAFPVKGTLFDKTPDANWLVPWHQDLTISVTKRVDVDGYGPWTTAAECLLCHGPLAQRS